MAGVPMDPVFSTGSPSSDVLGMYCLSPIYGGATESLMAETETRRVLGWATGYSGARHGGSC